MGIVTSLKSIDRLLKVGDFSYAAGTAGTVNVPSGKSVVAIHADNNSGITTATIVIDSGDTVSLPTNSDFSTEIPVRSLVGPISIVFTDTSSYYVGMVDIV